MARDKVLTSSAHPLVKLLVSIRKEKKERLRTQRVLVVGERVIREIARCFPIELLIRKEDRALFDLSFREEVIVSFSLLQKITGLPAPEGVAALFPLPLEKKDIPVGRFLILDRLSDPGNVGTLLRSAWALGWTGAILSPQTADPFGERALRASKGAAFFFPIFSLKEEEIRDWIKREKTPCFLADIQGEKVENVSDKGPLALILSHEAQGPSLWAQEVGQRITIPMKKEVHSLNVASAGSILLYLLGEKR